MERLAQLADRYGLDTAQSDQLSAVISAVLADSRSPTAIRDADGVIDLHVADSLVALEVPAVRAARRLVDIGSGAGFPGVPLAVALPDASVHLLDSQTQRCLFLRRLCSQAALGNAEVVWTRAEAWRPPPAVEVVVARALAPQPVVLEYAAPLLAPGGMLVDWRGSVSETEIAQAMAAAEILGLMRVGVRQVQPFPSATRRFLHLYLKVRATPERFPRRAGMAAKRPLGRDGSRPDHRM